MDELQARSTRRPSAKSGASGNGRAPAKSGASGNGRAPAKSGTSGNNGRRPAGPTRTRSRRTQAQAHAEAARRKASERREQQSGAAGWIADRAGEWSLDGPDWSFVER
ncbi:MAG TPA: hypothetical protein VIH85_18495, partial [Solirubrobacteraceae bacterium]